MAAVRQELDEKLVGGRVQNAIMPGPLTISLEVYRGGVGRANLLLSAHPQHARVHLLKSAPSRDPEQHPPLLLLLRKYVRGGTLVSVSQPRYERVLVLSIAKRFRPDKHQEYHSEGDFRDREDERRRTKDEGELESDEEQWTMDDSGADPAEADPSAGYVVTTDLVMEVMGRLSNIVLVAEDGAILDSIKRIPPSINRYRTTLPHHPYVPPPSQEKRDPMRATINTLSLELSKAADEDQRAAAWKGLVSGFSAISPALAREIVFQALGDKNVAAVDVARQPALLTRVLDTMRAMFEVERAGWEVGVAWREGEAGERKPIEFAPYPLTHLAQENTIERYDSISEAIAAYFGALENWTGHSALKAQVRAELEELRNREDRKLRALREEWERAQALEHLRHKGEMLLGYMHMVAPGQRQLTVPEEGLVIDLDPSLSPADNAQAIFKEYRKARSAHEGLPERIAEAEMRVGFADELLTSLDLASTYDEIRAVQAELQLARNPRGQSAAAATGGKQKTAKGKNRKSQEKIPQPLRLRTRYGAHLLVGRTATQSDTATFRLASPEDLWFHARGVPGGHVILRTEPGVTPNDIEEAASIAAAYSKSRTEAQVDVIYTEKRYVRRVPNAPPGFVTFKNERVIRVAPRVKAQ
jgi:predicted ribosome quality control (RQC) complex YloA/Tae2 family protein